MATERGDGLENLRTVSKRLRAARETADELTRQRDALIAELYAAGVGTSTIARAAGVTAGRATQIATRSAASADASSIRREVSRS